MDAGTLLFFDGHTAMLPLYDAFEVRLRAMFPAVNKRVQKTQITFSGRCVFACISFAGVRRKAELPAEWITLTLGLPTPPDSPRVAVRVRTGPGRWTCHIVISRPEELDDELFSWVTQAWHFAETKRPHGTRGRQNPGEEPVERS